MADRLSLKARALPEALSNLAKFGGGAPNGIVLDAAMLMDLSAAADELLKAAEPGDVPSTGIVIRVYEDGALGETQPLAPEQYVVLCGERRAVTHEQHSPTTGTVVLTIKRVVGK